MIIFNIANHITKIPLFAMKLQKFCYYVKGLQPYKHSNNIIVSIEEYYLGIEKE